ncbi:Sec-independent protein translocase subunit TatA [Streptacidiphilus fuscans]|uniref:Sec-independent protein translocase protein TatA n=1 Tax=Streptacidiphilus fuscans TaxID=2789292 RepID=A0A931B787_9ACTN|nr:Sec-independent protein translocase subunit TatA [Streptacidiphilus fuscans]MBF9069128.1 Sec-independent protein translocase subunit TatA [Streptacidiphilus fuscans]
MLENRALEIVIVALVVLVLFGAKRLPDSARALGRSLRILKAETRALHDEPPADPTEPAAPDTSAAADPATPLRSAVPEGPVAQHADTPREKPAHTT